MIRVLVAYSRPGETGRPSVEAMVRSIPSLEYAGEFDLLHPAPSEAIADVLLVVAADIEDADLRAYADVPVPVILMPLSFDTTGVRSALRLGIRGVISPDATPDEVQSAIHAVHAGLAVTMPAVIAGLVADTEFTSDDFPEPLSDRENEVLELLAEGLSNRLIAQALNISEHTVKTHVSSIFARLGVSSRTEAVSQAIRRGLIML